MKPKIRIDAHIDKSVRNREVVIEPVANDNTITLKVARNGAAVIKNAVCNFTA